MTTYTDSLRLREPAVLGDDGTWATYLNSNMVYTDQGVNGILSKSLAGLTTYSLVADGGSGDEARYQTYQFTGVLSGNCTVTIPANVKQGWAQNATTGGFNVILTTGSGTTFTVPPDSAWHRVMTTGTGISYVSAGFGAVVPSGSIVPRIGVFKPGTDLLSFATATAEQMRISSDGTLLHGQFTTTTPITAKTAGFAMRTPTGASTNALIEMYSAVGNCASFGVGTSGRGMNFFYNGSNSTGSITISSGLTTSYNTTSDQRLKIDDGALEAGDIIDRLKPRWFRFKSDPDRDPQPGFFAQQVHRVFPWAVTPGKGKPGRKNSTSWQMDAAKLVPVLVAELQALRKRVAALERA